MKIPSLRRLLAPSLCLASACQPVAPAGSATTSATTSTSAMPSSSAPAVQATSMEQAGEYLTIVAGCNDCHTQGWTESEGRIPPAERLAGFNVGFRGSWGTTYGKNLRQITQRITEDRWVSILTTSDGGDGKPPMPWWNTKQMSDRDLRAMYRYIRSLGPRPNAVPRGLPAGREPAGPWVWVSPRTGP